MTGTLTHGEHALKISDVGFGGTGAPTLAVDDPVLPLPRGEALHDAIPAVELLVLAGVGPDLPRPVWDGLVSAPVSAPVSALVRRAQGGRS